MSINARNAKLVAALSIALPFASMVESLLRNASEDALFSGAATVVLALVGFGLLKRIPLARILALLFLFATALVGAFQLVTAGLVLHSIASPQALEVAQFAVLLVVVPLCFAAAWWLSGKSASAYFSRREQP
jgi:hypothetical protein